MELHQRQVIVVDWSRYETGFGGLDNLKYKQTILAVLTNSIWYSFYFHQAAPAETFSDGPTPMNVYMPVIGKCL
jgi:hypothetical protein